MTAAFGKQHHASRQVRCLTPDNSTLPITGLNVRRRGSGSTTSLASSLSDLSRDAREVAATESDDGSPSVNSAAECDREEEEESRTLLSESPHKATSSCR